MKPFIWIAVIVLASVCGSVPAANAKGGAASAGTEKNKTAPATAGNAETTPLSDPLVEQKETLITCELKQAPKLSDTPVFDSAKEAADAKGVYHYKLWIPEGYNADSKKAWPCMFIASPSGKAGMGNMAAWLKASGYVVVMLVESKNGPYAPTIGNFLAAHDDVVKRVRIQDGLKFATGQSGGARASATFVQMRPGFAGVILQAAGASQNDKGVNRGMYYVAKLKGSHPIFVAMIMGDKDSNKSEVERMKALISSPYFMVFPFDGGHAWAPADVFEKAMGWMEQQLYRRSSTSSAVKKLLQPRCAPTTK